MIKKSLLLSAAVFACSLALLAVAADAATTLPPSFSGSATYHFNNPSGMTTSPSLTIVTSNDMRTLTFTNLTFAQASAYSWNLTGGNGTLSGSLHSAATSTDAQMQTHTCNYDTTLSRDAGAISGHLDTDTADPPHGYLSLTVPMLATYSNATGDCDASNYSATPGHYMFVVPQANLVYDATKQTYTITTVNQTGNAWTANGTLTGSSGQQGGGGGDVTQCPTITVLPSTLPHAIKGQPYRQQLTGSGGQPPYTFSTAGPLPQGLTLSAAGLLSGTPTVDPGQYPINFNFIDAETCPGSNQMFALPQGATLLLVVEPSNAFKTNASGKGHNGAILLGEKVPGKGVLSAKATFTQAAGASAAKVRSVLYGSAKKKVTKAGKVSFTIKPSAAGRRALGHLHRLKVKVAVTFTPTGGSARTKTITTTVG
jgi:hypothetical protein